MYIEEGWRSHHHHRHNGDSSGGSLDKLHVKGSPDSPGGGSGGLPRSHSDTFPLQDNDKIDEDLEPGRQRQYCIKDFDLIRVIGRGSYAKVGKNGTIINPRTMISTYQMHKIPGFDGGVEKHFKSLCHEGYQEGVGDG